MLQISSVLGSTLRVKGPMRWRWFVRVPWLTPLLFIFQILMVEKQDVIIYMDNTSDLFSELKYQNGLGNTLCTEALQGAVPLTQNSPIKVKYGLYPEQLSGTAFTVKRAENAKVWYYKLRPSAVQGQYKKSNYPFKIIASYLEKQNLDVTPNQLRWKAIPQVATGSSVNFIEGLTSLMGAGEPSLKQGISIYAYSANTSMGKSAFYNSDGDFLIVPHAGVMKVRTLNGLLTVKPHEILVIPRGIIFSIDVETQIRGWVAEVFGQHFSLPELGPIGANGLANPGDFQFPTAWYEDKKQEWTIWNKYIGEIYEGKNQYSPYDVVGWKGNYSPYKYNLDYYNTIGTISFDHPDPCLFTVLTVKSPFEGTAVLDFVIFPPRWLVAEHTFKPPYYHRNCMTEFMGNISGEYDAKKAGGFVPGGSSLHSTMTAHGPDADSYQRFVLSEQKPYKIGEQNLAFMLESMYLLKTTKFAMQDFAEIDKDYAQSWQRLATIKYPLE